MTFVSAYDTLRKRLIKDGFSREEELAKFLLSSFRLTSKVALYANLLEGANCVGKGETKRTLQYLVLQGYLKKAILNVRDRNYLPGAKLKIYLERQIANERPLK